MTVLLVDVSHWQPPNVPWGALKDDGVRAAIIKLCHGRSLDANAYKHLEYARSAGLLTGFYHWLTPTEDPAEQARAFVSLIPRDWRGRLAVDVEEPGVTDAILGKFIDAFDGQSFTNSFPLIIYTGKNFWDNNIGARNDFRYRRFELWAAGGVGYDQHESQPPAGYHAPIPYPWTSAALEQFTGKGRLAGYDADIDISISHLTEPEFVAWWTLDYLTLWKLLGEAMATISDADAKTIADGLSSIMLTVTQLLPLIRPAPAPVPPPTTKHSMANLTGQQVINLFYSVFHDYNELAAAGMPPSAPQSWRSALYSGPAVEDMQLTDAQKANIIAALTPQG